MNSTSMVPNDTISYPACIGGLPCCTMRTTVLLALAAPARSAWVLSNRGESCEAACAARGLGCDLMVLSQVDTVAKIEAAAMAAGHSCTSTSGWAYGANPAICTELTCCGGSCVGACAHGVTSRSCGATNAAYSRLCPCSADMPPSRLRWSRSQSRSWSSRSPTPPPTPAPRVGGGLLRSRRSHIGKQLRFQVQR